MRGGSNFIDLIGKRFGKLVAISISHRGKDKNIYWKCKCDCGNEKIIKGISLRRNMTKSCGCAQYISGKENPRWKGYGEITGDQYEGIKRVAKLRKIKFNVSIKYLWDLFVNQQRKCCLSGIPLLFKTNHESSGTASLDRIDSSFGYIKGNVQWVHKDVNIMKNQYSQEKYIEICKKVATYDRNIKKIQ